MPKFAANLTTMFTEWDFLDRFAAAADLGFKAVEFQFAYDHPPEDIAQRLESLRLTLALFNAPPGDHAAGDRGLAALSGRENEFRASIARAKIYAEHTNPQAVHIMAGIADASDPEARRAYVAALRFAVERLDGFDVTIEPLNPRDTPGYFLSSFDLAADVIAEIGHSRLKLQYDIYHRQILHGDVVSSLRALMPIIGHVQIASAPGRNEPGTGELNDEYVLKRLDALGYRGYVGCEYRPAKGTLAGLNWMTPWLRRHDDVNPMFKSAWRDNL